jgi:hypothetical protein
MNDLLSDEAYRRFGDDLAAQGLYLDLPAHGAQLFQFRPVVGDPQSARPPPEGTPAATATGTTTGTHGLTARHPPGTLPLASKLIRSSASFPIWTIALRP